MSTSKRSKIVAYRAVTLVLLLVLSTAVIGVGNVVATTGTGTPVVDASSGATTYTVGGAGAIIDPAIVVSDTSGGTYDGARVVIQNLQAGDQLAFTAQHGIASSYDSSAGVLTLTGTATAVEYQSVFRSVTFTNTGASPDTSNRRITFSLGSSLPSDENGHFYEYVDAGTGINWDDANASANARTYFGLQGYLVTVTSQGENDFVAEKLQGDGWIGASDDTAFSYISEDANGHDRWHWVTGPEAGTHFWTGDEEDGFDCDADGCGEPVDGQYSNWDYGINDAEPNDYRNTDGAENYAHFRHTADGKWNDFPGGSTVAGYVVEYGGLASDPAITWRDTKTVAVDETPVVTTSTGDTDYLLGDQAVVVDPSVNAADGDGDRFDGARVVIQNLHPDDVLDFTAQHGITGSYDATSGVLTLTGNATADQYQDVFRSVSFSNANTIADATDRRITFALGATLPFDETGHFYEYIDESAAGGITWHDANQTANGKDYLGLQGYLATVTSQEENDFIAEKLQGDGWIGASDDTAFSYISKDSNGNDQWHWVTGPEAGTHFWTGGADESVNEPANDQYANWALGEPNDWGGDGKENYAHFWTSYESEWNDYPGGSVRDGYVVEYGGFGNDTTITWRDTKTVAVSAPPTNVAPSISVDDGAVSVNEGTTATNGGTVSDADGDLLTLTASIGTVVDNGDDTWNWSFDTTDGPDDSQTVTITATDDEDASSAVSFDLTVNNVAPSVNADNASVTVDEGQPATNTGTFADPGDDIVTVTASVGTVTQQNDGTWTWSFDANDGPTDSQAVTVTATDSDGAATQTSFQLTVSNVAPVLSADVNDTGVAGSPVSASGSFIDVGIEDTHTVTIDWDDGTDSSATVTQGSGSDSFSGSHVYATGGYYDVTVTVSDDDGGVDSHSETTTVAHLATVDVKPDSSANPVNSKAKGVLPVAILNNGDFDLTKVDVSTLRLSATEGGAGAATAHDGHLEDVDDDGDLDLLLHFNNQDIGITDDSTTVYLSGFMMDGVPIVATDMVDPTPVGNDGDDDADASGNGKGKGNGRSR